MCTFMRRHVLVLLQRDLATFQFSSHLAHFSHQKSKQMKSPCFNGTLPLWLSSSYKCQVCCAVTALQSRWDLSLDSYTVLYSVIKSGIVPLCKCSKALGKDWPWLQFGLKRFLHDSELQCSGHKERARLFPLPSFREAAARNRSTDLDMPKRRAQPHVSSLVAQSSRSLLARLPHCLFLQSLLNLVYIPLSLKQGIYRGGGTVVGL